jgi:hypothetical protein
VSLEDQVPKFTVFESDVVVPAQRLAAPVIDAGVFPTVTVKVAEHGVPILYVIVVVPYDTAVTTPVPASTVATVGSALDHAPPIVALDKAVVAPGPHISAPPVIAAGVASTVSIFVTYGVQPVLYVTLTVPAATPVSRPDALPIVATAPLLVVQTP